jgi:sulfide:quinone oxidoreductase
LSDEVPDQVEVTLIDQSDHFVFGYSKLDVMFGRQTPDAVKLPYRDIAKPSVAFRHETVTKIDPVTRIVTTDRNTYESDILVVALGADIAPELTPGLVEGGNEFYTVEGAFATRAVLEEFTGGRVVVGVTSTPFKCPPAPSETALMAHDYLTERGLRAGSEVSLVMPIPPSPDASAALIAAFAERNINWHPNQLVRGLDPARKMVLLADGGEMPYDLFLGIPVHRAPAVVRESDLCVDGWIPVDPLTLETSFPGVYAVGDVTSVGTPKAGVFAEGQAGVVADALIARERGRPDSAGYDGRGICYLEFGDDQVARVDVTFQSGKTPAGHFEGPSGLLAADKSEFGSSRVRRWFAREWTTH